MNKYYSRIILFKLFEKCNFNSLIETTTYNSTIKILFNIEFVTNVKHFLTYLLEYYSKYTFKNIKLRKKIDYKFTKKLLTMILIVKYPSIVFNNNTEYNESIIDISNELYSILNKLTKNDRKILYFIQLIDNIHNFMNYYNLWSMLDKRINTYVLLKLYHTNIINKLEIPHNSKLFKTLEKSIDNDQEELLKSVKYMKDDNELKFFNYYKDNISYTKTIDENLYLIDLKYKFGMKSPDKLLFVELVKRTKTMLKECVPNKKIIHDNIDLLLDVDLMTTYINNGIIDTKYFYTIISIIINKVKQFQSKNEDNSLENFRNLCQHKLENKEFYKNFIPMFFIEVFKRLDKIIKYRNAFIKLINK